jgi:hypothetical protein
MPCSERKTLIIFRAAEIRGEPSFADMLTTLRRVTYEEKTEETPSKRHPLKTLIDQLAELLSQAG